VEPDRIGRLIMADKRNPTEHTEERTGRKAADGPPDLPEGAERAEYADYDAGQERSGRKAGRDREAEAEREADLQPDGDGDPAGAGGP
jgi:hypothetical protein